MKNLVWNTCLSGLFIVILLACDEDPLSGEGNDLKIAVHFETATKEINEDAEEETIILRLDRPAPADAILFLKPGGDFAGNLTTAPEIVNGLIRITVQKGDVAAQIALKPTDNSDQHWHKTITLALHQLTPPFFSGTHPSINITIHDDETTHPYRESVANFIRQEATIEETYAAGIEYQIHFSEPVAIDSEITIALTAANGTYGSDFVTEPEAENNLLILPVAAGSSVIRFKVKPVDNSYITGHLSMGLSISETSGSIRKGTHLQDTFTIKDDELTGKPRGYEISAGNIVAKRFYEYDALGRIAKVNWENFNPYRTAGTEVYHYDNDSRLVKIDKYPGREIVYHWSGERITRFDEVSDGQVRHYSELHYDESGNVGLVTSYHLQPDGTYAKGLFTLYLYFMDGNLFKSLTYQDTQDPEEPYLVSTKTYEGYIDAFNPFPMSEIVPTVKTQTKLATTYRIEEGALDKTYQMVYEYRPDGRPGKRIATATGDLQTAVYHYY